jgi:8-oxo-dGTP diphosphatase
MRRIVAGVLVRDGDVLICRRRRDAVQPLKWEFPGGKVEPGESETGALVRELREELSLTATPGELLARLRHAYAETGELELAFFLVERFTGEPENRVFDDIAWAPLDELPGFDFLDADREFVLALSDGRVPLKRESGAGGLNRR